MSINKYKKLLAEKKKIIQATTQPGDALDKVKFVNFFNPNKYVKGSGDCFVRVLPRKNDLFFMQFKKHSFKVGTSWKNAFCFYSRDGNGETVGSECPFCDFIEENKTSLSRDTLYKISAKNSHMFLVYNYQVDEVQKYEANDYRITDVLTAMQSGLADDETEDFDVDREGFDLFFKKGETGYAEVYKVEKPSVTISELMKSSKNFTEIPNLEREVIPPFNDSTLKSIRSMLELAVSVFEPTLADKSGEGVEKDEEEYTLSGREDEFDPNDVEFSVEDEVIESEELDDDEDVEDIKNFLKNRRK